ncbi:MAG: ABC transporter permease, partial [Bacteroidales bacterium]|nr:ABC transporter permease [Bacteroidales bacterium]
RPGANMHGGVMQAGSGMQTMTMDDYDALNQDCQYISLISPIVNSGGQSIYGSNNWPTSIYGVYPDYLDIRELELKSGSMFTMRDVNASSKVVVIGQTVVENLFPDGEDPIGKIIRFRKIPFKVIGVLEEKGESNFGQDQDDILLAPMTAVQKRVLAQDYIHSIIASSVSEEKSEAAVAEIQEILRIQHEIKEGEEDDFNVFSMDELLDTISSTSEMLTLLLVAIASISLLVGGIGIMNIMYVSVKERTREIGLRMAVGARGASILMQFLIEAVIISFVGGIIGILLGLSLTYLVHFTMNWPIIISTSSILLSFAVCAITGIFFGWYPAKKASTLDPLEALRYE